MSTAPDQAAVTSVLADITDPETGRPLTEMVDFYFQLHPVVQGFLKGLAVILVIFPLGGLCSMAER